MLRQGPKPEGKILTLGGFEHTVDGESRTFQFLNSSMEPDLLVIDTVREFNLSNKADAHNWTTLQIWNAIYGPEMSPKLILNDPYEASEKESKKAEQVFGIHQQLMAKKNDRDWLAKVYRRVLGVAAAGLTDAMAFSRLFETASATPEKFFVNGQLVFESAEFENMALIDLAIEKGALLKDAKGFIKQADGKIFANDYAEAVHLLNRDQELKAFVLRTINREPEPFKSFETVKMSEDIAALIDQVGTKTDTLKFNEDGSVASKTEEETEAEIKTLVDTLIDKNLILKRSGEGNKGTSYRLEEFDENAWTTKSKIVQYFLMNKAERDRYQKMV